MVLCTTTCESTNRISFDKIAEGFQDSGEKPKAGRPQNLKAAGSDMLPDPNK
jgi:hypothetical protein